MSRLVPPTLGDQVVEILLAAGAVLVLCALGCATEPPPAPLPAWVAAGAVDPAQQLPPSRDSEGPQGKGADTGATQALPPLAIGASSPTELPPAPALGTVTGRNESADFVVSALRGLGLRFGTDGSARALWGYMKEAHRPISAREARRGDVLFFNVRGPADPVRGPSGLSEGCADHVALVWNHEPDGRIVFLEVRNHRKRFGYVSPTQPASRRADDGRVLNTFLRPKKPHDGREARYLAGEMLCGVARPNL